MDHAGAASGSLSPAAKLAAVRALLAADGLDGMIVPRSDEHLGEYVPPAAERLAWLTGFTGSAGMAVVLADMAAVFSDGRYTLQLEQQTEGALWQRAHLVASPPAEWAAKHAPGARLGYDPWLLGEPVLAAFTKAGLHCVPLERNPIDAAWSDRPSPPMAPARPHPLDDAGESSADKRERLAKVLRDAGQDAAVITDPASIAWLLNIRGSDVEFTPVALGFATLHADGQVELFMAEQKLPAETRAWLGNQVQPLPREALPGALAGLAGKTVRVDLAGSPAWFAAKLRQAGATLADAPDPCLLPKACKNATEQRGARDCHRRDAVALCRFLHWLERAPGQATELSAAARLVAFRQELEGFRGESFAAISSAGEHGAVIHYRVEAATDRPINPDEVYLIDSGAQFHDGTTDVTRTVWTGPSAPPESLRDRYTRVLKGHVALSALTFPQGVAGAHLDAFARAALWQVGLDYDHGTGHGVGSYLSVHEGPARFHRDASPVPLAPGMILSNEPGFYLPGSYGLRVENLLLVVPAELDCVRPGAAKPFLRFETLTLAPYDRRLVVLDLLTRDERHWIDDYHARVLDAVAPSLADDGDRLWLQAACRPL